ncbi:putative o-succinylhomoserine (thiol)-lyase [Coleophoma cylindrospora]|uniref:cystathionine gamma-synthase n=1 Tax=Coleophoma cylindrospora TaxID=1849047 RepID=A0A3D8R1R8_9HELO|nr:putative o-succinylhomoserine (thiol)-lyase [Coleophoma cylindrospora]
MSIIELGESIPALTPHAASVSLPTWRDNVAYEEGQERVLSKMVTGYPRFFIHKLIVAFAEDIVKRYGSQGQQAMLFPSTKCARRCAKFIISRDSSIDAAAISVLDLVLDTAVDTPEILRKISPTISAVLFPGELFPYAKQYWQHSGDGVSSRRAEFCHTIFLEGLLVDQESIRVAHNEYQKPKGPKRYQRGSVDKPSPNAQSKHAIPVESDVGITNGTSETRESSQFVEERFGRNLDVSFVNNAQSAIRRRIAGSLIGDVDLGSPPSPTTPTNLRGVSNLSEDDVYLYPCGMNSIFHAHRTFLEARGPLKSISFGFPYVDTLKILEKFGPGCIFYGNGSSEDLDDLEERLKAGERFLALFCEFPGNPMLKSPDLKRIRGLADKYDFGVVVDETIGNFINVHVLPHADMVVSSLTKIFSGECNVMGGSTILNPQGKYYQTLKSIKEREYENNYWAEDIIFMERNSRHFVSHIERINENAEAICNVLREHPLVKDVYYPKYNPTRCFYDDCRTENGGYGGLLSLTFHTKAQAIAFFDRIETAKGPSLGTNFTLTSPYVVLAHFMELDWAAQFGVPADLIRMSVGLEDMEDLKGRVESALKAAEAVSQV